MNYHDYHSTIVSKYGSFEYIRGHSNYVGQGAGKERNPIWIVRENNEEQFIMYCEPGKICVLCRTSYQKVLDYEKDENNDVKISWSIHKNGYVYGHTKNAVGSLAIHQLIMNHYGHGRGTGNTSVDHLDRNPANNMMTNLRIATREEQMLNTKGIIPGTKRERQIIARELPDGLTQEMMPKYITYNVNMYGEKKEKKRDYFRIEGHPFLKPKSWDGSKSSQMTILDKLNQARETLIGLDNGELPKSRRPV
jgi:hypothetical protein